MFFAVLCNIIIQYKPTKCTISKLIFQFLILLSSTCFKPVGSSSGKMAVYAVMVWYDSHLV